MDHPIPDVPVTVTILVVSVAVVFTVWVPVIMYRAAICHGRSTPSGLTRVTAAEGRERNRGSHGQLGAQVGTVGEPLLRASRRAFGCEIGTPGLASACSRSVTSAASGCSRRRLAGTTRGRLDE